MLNLLLIRLYPDFHKRLTSTVENLDLVSSQSDRVTQSVAAAIAVIRSVDPWQPVADRLARRRIEFAPRLRDRAMVSFLGVIKIGPEAANSSLISLAGTLVHEEWHTRQPLLHRTWSFWRGVFTRQHPMKWLEWPAYNAQIAFLQDAFKFGVPEAGPEAIAVLQSFVNHYGSPDDESS